MSESSPTANGPDFSRGDGLLPAIAQDSRTGEVRSPVSPGNAHDGAPCRGIPPGTAEAGESRDEVHAVVAGDLRGKRSRLGRLADQSKTVAQPLDRRSGREDGAFEGIVEPVGGALG